MIRIYLVAAFVFISNVFAFGQNQIMESMPGPIIVCPSGEFDGHHHTPVPAEIMQKILQKDGSEPCANITVVYTGFTTEAQNAFQAAVDIWAYSLSTTVTVVVEASWEPLGAGVLGAAGPALVFKNFPNAPTSDRFPVALANQIAGYDLSTSNSDIVSFFNSDFDWYYGTDGNPPNNKYDLMTVVLHELGHGFGFSSYSSYNAGTNTGSFGTVSDPTPLYYDKFLVSGQNGSGLVGLSGTALGNAFKSNNIFCNSPAATSILGGNQPKIFAPVDFSQGSSLSHWDETSFPAGTVHSLMTPYLTPGEAIHNPGPITLALFEDMGWAICDVVADDECLTWQDPSPTTAWGDFNDVFGGAPCDDGTGCPFNEIQDFQVNASEAYSVDGFMEGGEYTFSICNGSDAGSWIPDFTIIAPSGAVDAAGGGTGCAISWTASESGTYLIIINQAGNCGMTNPLLNGYPALTCGDGTVICEPSNCATESLQADGETTLCPGETVTVYLDVPATIPVGNFYGISFYNVETESGVNLTNANLPYTFDNDLNGLLSDNNMVEFLGTYEISGFIYSDPQDLPATICASSDEPLMITFLGTDDPVCSDYEDCLTWQDPTPATGWTNFNSAFGGAPCDDGTGCPFNEIQGFQVIGSEAYSVNGFIAGGEYTFSICNGPDAGSWIPDFTIIAPSGAIDATGSGTGCAISWTASESGTYLIVINEEGNCGILNSANNGYPALTCESGTVICAPSVCATESLQAVGETSLCPSETTIISLINPATIPAGGGYAINFYNTELGTGFNLTGVTLPLTIDNDLDGVLSENDIDLLEGEYELTGIVYTDPNDVSGSICAIADAAVIINFLSASDPACSTEEPCATETLVLTGDSEICPDETTAVNLANPATIPVGGGYAIDFRNMLDNSVIRYAGVTLPFSFDNDLNGFASANGYDLLEGEYELTGIVYSDATNFGGSICATADAIVIINFLSASDPACSIEEPCETETLVLTGDSEICPDETTAVNLANPATIPLGGGYAIDFRNMLDNSVIRYAGVTLPFSFDNDLNGFASANGYDLLEGEYELTGIVYADATDVDGSICTMSENSATVTFLPVSSQECVTGIEDLETEGGFVIYPNPASDYITLKLNDVDVRNTKLQIMDMGGRILFEETFLKLNPDNSYRIDVSKIAQGVYFVVLYSERDMRTSRLIISK